MAASGAQIWRRIIISLLVLVALLVGADRVSNYMAERAAGNTIESSQHLSSRPDVTIAGFPFLTQLAADKYDKITVTAKNMPVGKTVQLVISRLKVVLHELTVSRNFSRLHANTAAATGTVDYAELGKALDIDVTYAGNGRIKGTKSVSVAGRSFQASLATTPKLVNGALGFAGTSIDNAGQLGAAVTSTLNKVFDLSIPLDGLPFHIRVKALHADATGLHFDLTGRNLTYTK